ncbi:MULTISPECIES: hypothetical protein [Chromohalobacter]|uniref:Uncharacterized protein n=4 Tax=Chromohalobacter TaxID=42054 RepID=A0A1Q8TBT3_9GAMM|nr:MULTISPECIES: hypothetical protein [Chromohalobacter]NWO11923.1 hypothetical protein [Chromohalobacter salexigens]MCK0754077.1 hypothetical protein [Chromohalobacter japonicus]MCK0764501.1 hypothetical protein [Chromohalobacter beijerinckii]MCK2041337.1 hypothetical protein [Chromohalobacter moromii]MCK2044279.1 hypothetical protein [Chromohalobacter moromii]
MSDSPLPLAATVRETLEAAPREKLPMTYQDVADALGLQPPRTIQRVAQALEILMREDAAQGRSFIAALVVSRRAPHMPARGFFELAVELERFPADSSLHAQAWRDEYQRAMTRRE